MNVITDKSIETYKEHLLEEEKAKVTVEKYVCDVICFANWLCGCAVEKITVMEYKRELMKNYAPKSVNSKISSLNSFFEFNEWFECKIKILKIQKQIFSNKEKELTKSEYERLLKAAKEPTTLIMSWFSFTTVELWSLASIKKAKTKANGGDKVD